LASLRVGLPREILQGRLYLEDTPAILTIDPRRRTRRRAATKRGQGDSKRRGAAFSRRGKTPGGELTCRWVCRAAPRRAEPREVTPIGYVTTAAVMGSGVLGFLAGLFSFKVKTQWCRDCGEQLRCVACLQRKRAVVTQGTVLSGR
jgi:hypothetical protein